MIREPQGRALASRVTDQREAEAEQTADTKYLYGEISASSHPQLTTGSILLVSAWKKRSAWWLDSALESTVRSVSFLKVSVTEQT